MKLILLSDQSLKLTGPRDQEVLRQWTGKKSPTIGYVPAAPDPRGRYADEKAAYYDALGLGPLQILDPDADLSESDLAAFFKVDVIHLGSGLVAPFATRLQQSGLDQRLVDFARRKVLLGVSAGAMVMGQTFYSAKLCGEKHSDTNWCGLGLVDFEILPHWDEVFVTQDPIVAFARKQNITIHSLKDGDRVLVNGKKVSIERASS